MDTFRAPKESTGDEESPNGVGNCGGYAEEGEGIRLGQVGAPSKDGGMGMTFI